MMNNLNLWTDKYRPTTFENLKGQTEINKLLENSVKENKQIHCIFYGPPGTGKTSSALIYCLSIYPREKMSQFVLEINASYEQNIDVIQNKIKPFCQQTIVPFTNDKGKYIDFKIIILDEADTLSQEAQNALRRYIEIYSYNTRFIFMCNYISKIISPIISRCATFHFSLINENDSIAYLSTICEHENLFDTETLENEKSSILSEIYNNNHGDLRACTSSLQAIYMIYGKINIVNINKYFMFFPEHFLNDVVVSKLSNSTYTENYIQKKSSEIIQRSYHLKNFFLFCIRYTSSHFEYSDTIGKFIQNIATCEKYSLYQKNNYNIVVWVITSLLHIIKTSVKKELQQQTISL